MAYEKIPAELRGYRQWVTWRYEEATPGGKPTKIPYDPRAGSKASSTDPTTWVSYDEAVLAATGPYGYSGIGFVLSETDPYAFIDLDDTHGDQDAVEVQKRIYAAFTSYSEYSPSKRGLHIIVRGTLPRGRKRAFVEVYSSGRFMTMTGDTFSNVPIIDCNPLLNLLWAQLRTNDNDGGDAYAGDAQESANDQEVFDRARSAANGDKFLALWKQEVSFPGDYPSQSEADMALMNILAFYTKNRAQLARLFRFSALGQRDKAKRDQYLKYMIDRSFDRQLPPVDFDAVRLQMEAALQAKAVSDATRPPMGVPATITQSPIRKYEWPTGFLGEIAKHMYANAARPVKEVAIVSAIAMMAGIMGRRFNVSKQGLNQYILLLTGTGKGKEAIHSGIASILKHVAVRHPSVWNFIGPSEIQSPEALVNHLSGRCPSFVSLVGEFGLKLEQYTSRNASSSQIGLLRAYLDLYHKSGPNGRVGETAYADSKKNVEPTQSPAFSMVGDSVPENFYAGLNGSMVTSGLLPRFTIVEYTGDRVPLNPNVDSIDPPQEMIDQLVNIAAACTQDTVEHKPCDVGFTDEAKALFDAFEIYTTDIINANTTTELVANLWNRAHLKAMKLAALVAACNVTWGPLIDLPTAQWGIDIVTADVTNLIGRFSRGEIGVMENSDKRQVEAMQRVIGQYYTKSREELKSYHISEEMYRSRLIPVSYIRSRCSTLEPFKTDRAGATAAVNRTLHNMAEGGYIQDVPKNQMESAMLTKARALQVLNTDYFGITTPKLV